MTGDEEEGPWACDIALVADDEGFIQGISPDSAIVLKGLCVTERDDARDFLLNTAGEILDSSVCYSGALAGMGVGTGQMHPARENTMPPRSVASRE